MNGEAHEAYIRPNPQIPKTFGILNIIFSAILLTCIPCVGAYIAFLANIGTLVEAQVEQEEQQRQARRKATLDELAEKEAEAATEEEKAAIRAERARVAVKGKPVVVNTPDFDAMMGGIRQPRQIAYYAVDFGTAMILNALMLASGIGLIRLRPWGRKLCLGVMATKIARLLILGLVNIMLIVPASTRLMAEGYVKMDRAEAEASGRPFDATAANREAREISRAMGMMSTIYVVGLTAVGIIYPAIALWALTRPAAEAACRLSKPDQGASVLD